MTDDHNGEANDTNHKHTELLKSDVADQPLTEDHPLYHPPKNAESADRLDAAFDGTSASHYGTNDPANFENTENDQNDE